MKKLLFIIAAIYPFTLVGAQSINKTDANVEKQVTLVLNQMTLKEKIDFIGGINGFYIRGIEKANIPPIVMADGPVGVRNYGKSTAYPAGILASATWDTALVNKLGIALGRDARARNVNILLAPGINIYRAPMCGRNFEYLGEDPFLSSRMAVNYINGVQSQRVAATVKHFAGNNQEWDRYNTSSDIDERTLQEIYLPAFKAAVKEANVACVMNSYNLVNGQHATQNAHLNIDILKKSWGFRGILMSDWVSVHNGIEAAKNGLDLEMPSAEYMNAATLLPAIKNGTISEETINDKVRRILRVIYTYHFNDGKQLDATIAKDDKENSTTALNLARAGIVLLKNEQNILPLTNIKNLAVISLNGDGYIAGGGSSNLTPFHYSTLIEGLKSLAPANMNITHVSVSSAFEKQVMNSVFYNAEGNGLKAEYFNNDSFRGQPVFTRSETHIDHHWPQSPDIAVANFPEDHFSIRWTGYASPKNTDTYKFTVRGDDGYRLWINDSLVLNEWRDQGALKKSASLVLEAGKKYNVKLEYYENGGNADISFGWGETSSDLDPALEAAKNADLVIIQAGFNQDFEGEGSDRTFELPENQAEIITALCKKNPNTVVILNAGGNVYMQNWLPKIKGLLHAWYAGQEAGTAMAEILLGKINPSGKLPVSFEKEWKDNPTHDNYYDEQKTGKVEYKEGLFVGYRYYDTSATKPQFPFGFGLSYTSFAYSNINVKNIGKSNAPLVEVSFNVKNTGNKDGAEVAQLYVHQDKCSSIRPIKELKAFSKVFLRKGETKKITMCLTKNAFSYYKTSIKNFGYDSGAFTILVGASCEDIKLQKNIIVQ